MVEINRRNAMLATGSVALLAACNKAKAPLPETLGPCLLHGLPAYGPGPIGIPFTPAFACVVYMRFDSPGRGFVVTRHAYFSLAGLSAAQERDRVIALLKEAKNFGGPWHRKLPGDADQKNNYPNKNYRKARENFDDFEFGSPQRLYFFIDNDTKDVEFDGREWTDQDQQTHKVNLVRFTQYLADTDPTKITQTDAEMNRSFFNARLEGIDAQPWKGRQMLILENWYLNKDGDGKFPAYDPTKPETAISLKYSMNIGLLAKSVDKNGAISIVPMVIDPTSGNGNNDQP